MRQWRMKMSNFDFTPQEEEVSKEHIGDLILYRVFDGTWEAGQKSPSEHDPSKHNWKAQYLELQFFPIGGSDFVQYFPMKFSKNAPSPYKELFDSIRNGGGNPAEVFQNAIENKVPVHCRWEKLIIGERYDKKSKSQKDVWGYKVLEIYPTKAEMEKAADEKLAASGSSIDDIPTGLDEPKVEAAPLKDALMYLPGLAMQHNSFEELQKAIDEMPLLTALDLKDADVAKAATDANPDLLPW